MPPPPQLRTWPSEPLGAQPTNVGPGLEVTTPSVQHQGVPWIVGAAWQQTLQIQPEHSDFPQVAPIALLQMVGQSRIQEAAPASPPDVPPPVAVDPPAVAQRPPWQVRPLAHASPLQQDSPA